MPNYYSHKFPLYTLSGIYSGWGALLALNLEGFNIGQVGLDFTWYILVNY